jgi:hypothetical protein
LRHLVKRSTSAPFSLAGKLRTVPKDRHAKKGQLNRVGETDAIEELRDTLAWRS